ncbi:MAG: glycosyltransferase family 2 protein [Niastella sp.]|nr:glycosyltransferase family 2 protein [Niastella sp.]
MNKVLVSIVISAYNAEKYIEQTLDSVLNQTWKPLEIIVVNDGSIDGTADILERYKEKGIIALEQENKGQDAALNTGFRHSKGSYVKFMDSDDLLNPEMIEKQMDVVGESEECVAYGEWARFFNDEPNEANFTPLHYWKDMKPLDFLTASASGVMLQCGIMLIPRKLIEIAGLWDERLILFNDTEFFNRILLASKAVKFSSGAKLYYRSGMPGSISAGRSKKYYESTYLAACLIGEQLLAVEDSIRTRKLVSNTFLMQYYHMYPKYKELQNRYIEKIEKYGNGSYIPDAGGVLFLRLKKIFGWKWAKRIQSFFYQLGYLKLLYKLKRNKT